jgi:hypothetical protein
MLMCTGCKHLNGIMDLCDAGKREPEVLRNPVTGRTVIVTRGHDGSVHQPSAVSMREEGQPCGPDRKLYEPNWKTRIAMWIFGGES